jgi:hypothetical protein
VCARNRAASLALGLGLALALLGGHMKSIDREHLETVTGGQVAQVAERIGIRALAGRVLRGAGTASQVPTDGIGINREWANKWEPLMRQYHTKGAD